MGRGSYGNSIGRASLASLCAGFVCLVLAVQAHAAPPVHGREKALDVPNLNHACGAAVDSKADVYASSAGEGKIKVFAPASHSTPIAEIANANEPCALAVQSDGTLYVSEQATEEVVRYEPNVYPLEASPVYGSREVIDSSGKAKGIAVDRADDRLYVAEGDHVARYTKEGAFEANLGEGDLTEATGVSAYTYIITGNLPTNLKRHYYLSVADASGEVVKVFSAKEEDASLKLRRTISGVDADGNPQTPEQQFGFGAKGAYLAADPGNESRETRACVSLAEQACTQGHFYLYDAANEALDEFDATGEFVDQLQSVAFEDAEPSALAIDRSGAASDGALYVSAGAGAGAELAAFAPLRQPSRALLATPLSKVLKGAKAVAVDCSGYVYVAAESLIRVYSPAGAELSSAADTHNAQDLAADCAGNVYVVDKSPEEMTYYSPAKYPPESGTTYTRHEPGLLVGGPLKAVAVNPADDHAFLLGANGTFSDFMVEFGPVSGGSSKVGTCGAGFAPFSIGVDIDVYGKTGQAYVSANNSFGAAISTFKCGAGSELLIRQIKGGGCPHGEPGSAGAIALDQSNGHIVQFQPGQEGASAREYDSAGACVAEFGVFSSSSSLLYKVAVDRSCALHDPPLSEQTTPTCKSFDPADGNAYVAFDATNNAVQPNDVTAFGPLTYGEGPEVETALADGFGPETATLNGAVNPHAAPLESCTFEYLTDAQYQGNGETFAGAASEECAETPAAIGNGETPVAVHAVIEGLETETTRYRFRLRAENAFGEDGGEAKGVLFGPPAASTEPALPVLYDEATLRGEVDPSGLQTSYRFQYLTEALYQDNGETFAGAEETPVGHVSPGEDPVAVKAPVTGLAEGTAYRFRLLAENEAAEGVGLDESFQTLARAAPQQCPNSEYRTGLSAFLPDCRAYELATPAQTLSRPGTFDTTAGHRYFNSWFVAPRGPGAGDSVAFGANVARVDGKIFRAQRGAGAHPAAGWGSEMYGLSFLQEAAGGEHRQFGVSADQLYMFHGVGDQEVETEQAFPLGNYMRVPAGQADPECTPEPRDVFEVADPAREFELVGCGELGTDADAEGRFISAGGTHVIFTSEEQLEPAAPAATEEIYDREAGSTEAEVVSTKPDGGAFGEGRDSRYFATTEDGAGVVFGQSEVQQVQVDATGGSFTLSFEGEDTKPIPYNASADIVQEKLRGAMFGGTGVVKVVGGPEGPTLATYSVVFLGKLAAKDAPTVGCASSLSGGTATCAVETTEGAALYLHREGQTDEIAEAPFTYAGISEDGQRVFFIDEAYAPSIPTPVPTAGLFACDVDAGPCAGPGAHAPAEIASSSILVNVSADGSHAFFTSEEELTGGEENDNGEEAQAGEHNLYAWDGSAVRFVAILDPADLESFRGEEVEASEDLLQWTNVIPGQLTTTGSLYERGRAFSPARSTPDGGVLVFQSHAHLTGYDSGARGEIYRYDPAAAAGERLLCVSCNPSGAPHLSSADALLQVPRGEATTPGTLIPNVTDDGQRVIFESFDALLPEDANEVSDVYEWQAPGYVGPGGDECERAAGCLALISSGHGEGPSQLFGMDADGSDVFFLTREELAGGDVSGSYSIYDARELGGIPDPPTPEGCQGDACQPPGPPPPALATPATTGGGEEPARGARRCAKGKHRVKGRCVKKKHKRHHRAHSRKKNDRANHDGRAHR